LKIREADKDRKDEIEALVREHRSFQKVIKHDPLEESSS
jgi:hypothetical protein